MATLIDNPCDVGIVVTQVYPNSATTVFTALLQSTCATGLVTDGTITATTITKIGKENSRVRITAIPKNGSVFNGWTTDISRGVPGRHGAESDASFNWPINNGTTWYALFDKDCSYGSSNFCFNIDKDKLCSSCEEQKIVYFDNNNNQYINNGITNNAYWYGTPTLETLITFSEVSSTNRIGWSFNINSTEISGGGTFKEVVEEDYGGCNRRLVTKIIKLQCRPSNLTTPYFVFLYKNGNKLYKFDRTGNSDIEILNIRGNPNDSNYPSYTLKYLSEGNQTITFTISTETVFEKSTSGIFCNGGYERYYSTVSTRPSSSGLIVPDGYYSQIINGYYSQYSVIYQILNGLIIDKSYCGSDILECNGSTGTIPNTTTIKGTNYNRIWSSKNLDVNHYNNGDPIPLVTGTTEWAKLTTGAYCYYNNDPANSDTYGLLYNWYAVNDSRGLAPTGWKVPSQDDWHTLHKSLGGIVIREFLYSPIGKLFKETGTTHWDAPNTGTNDTGFSGLPGGYRNSSGVFGDIRNRGHWWSKIGYANTSTTYAVKYYLFSDSNPILTSYGPQLNLSANKKEGLSIRLIRD